MHMQGRPHTTQPRGHSHDRITRGERVNITQRVVTTPSRALVYASPLSHDAANGGGGLDHSPTGRESRVHYQHGRLRCERLVGPQKKKRHERRADCREASDVYFPTVVKLSHFAFYHLAGECVLYRVASKRTFVLLQAETQVRKAPLTRMIPFFVRIVLSSPPFPCSDGKTI